MPTSTVFGLSTPLLTFVNRFLGYSSANRPGCYARIDPLLGLAFLLKFAPARLTYASVDRRTTIEDDW